jgi:tetratricopeptide (TPR) repeat protein
MPSDRDHASRHEVVMKREGGLGARVAAVVRSLAGSNGLGRPFGGAVRAISFLRDLTPSGRAESRRFTALCGSARTAQVQGDFEGAAELWAEAVRLRPNRAEAVCSGLECALACNHLDRAADLLEEAQRRFPGRRVVVAAAAQLAERNDDRAEAVRLWERIVDQRSIPAIWLVMYGHTLYVLGRFDDLDALLRRVRPRHPEASGLLALQAMLAGGRADWDAALDLWREFRQRFPDDPVGWEHYGRAWQERAFAGLESGAGEAAAEPVMPAEIDVVVDEATRDLLIGFESIGSDCEFGLVQRRYGAEPLGLLRFNGVEFGGLIAAVGSHFEAMGDPETTELTTLANGEFMMRDRRWGLLMHTFQFAGQVDPDVLREKFARRVRFLRDKLLADAAEGRKVFVFSSAGLDPDDLAMLHEAVRTLGPVPLLHVRPRSGEAVVGGGGTVDEIAPGLFVGTIGRSGRTPSGGWDIAFEDWVDVCRAVRDKLDAARDAPPTDGGVGPSMQNGEA